MDPPKLPLLLLLTFASAINAQYFPAPHCGSTGNFSTDSTYQTTLTALLSSISTTNSLSLTYGFFNASAAISGAFQTLSVIGSCRGDLTAKRCHTCLNGSASDIRRLCPLEKEAVLYSENCTIRYSNASIFGTVTTDPDNQLFNVNDVTSPDTYNAALQPLLDDLQGKAAAGGSLRKYATGNASADFNKIYAMVQCTPDLTEQQCSDCLVTVVARLVQCCAGKMGVNIMAPSCQFRYETNARFFDRGGEPLPPPPAPPPQVAVALPLPSGGKSNSNRAVIIVVATSGSAIFLNVVIVLLIVKRKKQPRQRVEGDIMDEMRAEALQFDHGTIREATDNFSDSKKLGQGGFGAVYMGRLSNEQEIVVKRLYKSSRQGDPEFQNEVMLLARLQHRNIVRLLGFCIEGEERLIIYEFVPNLSLDKFIFDPTKCANLNWDMRYKIIMGVTRGLLYLHEDSRLRIIHRDLKASNILLDSNMNAKISDFGLATLFKFDQTQAETNRIVGTYGYMAPEYAMHGNFSVKSDVYSFGVLVLEIVSGQRNDEILISYVWKNWREGTISNIMDPSITSGSSTEIVRCVHIGLLCVQENVADRPTMASILLMLNSHSVSLQVPSQPAFFMRSRIKSNVSSTQDYNSRVFEVDKSKSRSNQFSINEVSVTELYPR